jgi:hypothetical protein
MVFLLYGPLERALVSGPNVKLQSETPKAEPGSTLRTKVDVLGGILVEV